MAYVHRIRKRAVFRSYRLLSETTPDYRVEHLLGFIHEEAEVKVFSLPSAMVRAMFQSTVFLTFPSMLRGCFSRIRGRVIMTF